MRDATCRAASASLVAFVSFRCWLAATTPMATVPRKNRMARAARLRTSVRSERLASEVSRCSASDPAVAIWGSGSAGGSPGVGAGVGAGSGSGEGSGGVGLLSSVVPWSLTLRAYESGGLPQDQGGGEDGYAQAEQGRSAGRRDERSGGAGRGVHLVGCV